VGRALAISLSHLLLPPEACVFPRDAVSYVSVGDGSVNNAHFLSALNLAKYAQHRRIKVSTSSSSAVSVCCFSRRRRSNEVDSD
jgi:TPP-dependent pyruvate/acetoin dehydrogenase alpha subunit